MRHEQCPQLATLPEKVRQFWEAKQQELQEQLIRFSYAVFISPSRHFFVEKGGLLYLMERTLWFEDFPKTTLLSLIGGAPPYEKTMLHIPLAAIEQVKTFPQSQLQANLNGEEPRSNVFKEMLRFMGFDPICLFLSGTLPSGERFQYAFREMEEPDAWLKAISSLEKIC